MQIEGPDRTMLTLRADEVTREGSGNIIARGRIEAKHAGVSIACTGAVTVYATETVFSSLEARGRVEAASGKKTIRGNHLLYEPLPHLVTVSGDPFVHDGNTIYRAERRILCYTETGVMEFEPRAQIVIERGADRGKAKRGRKKFLGLF
jgi:hypothetical protein